MALTHAWHDIVHDMQDEMHDLAKASSAVGFLPKSRLSGTAVRDLLNGGHREAR